MNNEPQSSPESISPIPSLARVNERIEVYYAQHKELNMAQLNELADFANVQLHNLKRTYITGASEVMIMRDAGEVYYELPEYVPLQKDKPTCLYGYLDDFVVLSDEITNGEPVMAARLMAYRDDANTQECVVPIAYVSHCGSTLHTAASPFIDRGVYSLPDEAEYADIVNLIERDILDENRISATTFLEIIEQLKTTGFIASYETFATAWNLHMAGRDHDENPCYVAVNGVGRGTVTNESGEVTQVSKWLQDDEARLLGIDLFEREGDLDGIAYMSTGSDTESVNVIYSVFLRETELAFWVSGRSLH